MGEQALPRLKLFFPVKKKQQLTKKDADIRINITDWFPLIVGEKTKATKQNHNTSFISIRTRNGDVTATDFDEHAAACQGSLITAVATPRNVFKTIPTPLIYLYFVLMYVHVGRYRFNVVGAWNYTDRYVNVCA